jgi:hypothetical protein
MTSEMNKDKEKEKDNTKTTVHTPSNKDLSTTDKMSKNDIKNARKNRLVK